MKRLFAVFQLMASSASLFASDADGKFSLIILPVRQTVPNGQYEYLRNVISGILTANLRDQGNIGLAEPTDAVFADGNASYAAMKDAAALIPGIDVVLLTEFFIKDGKLHMAVTVVEAGSDRVKNSFIRAMPADLDMIANIEQMAKYVAESVAKSLPKLSRDEILSRQVAAELRGQMDEDERLVASIFGNSHELSLCPFAGVSTGKGMGSWSKAGPMATLPLSFEYRYLDKRLWQVAVGFDYLPFDLMQADGKRSEISAKLTAGFHTASIVSLSWEIGAFAAWSLNDASAAIAYLDGEDPAFPPARRFALGIPLEASVAYYWDKRWFTRMRFSYNGLSYTFEPLAPSDYPFGAKVFLYDKGLSPWSLAHFSFVVSMGIHL